MSIHNTEHAWIDEYRRAQSQLCLSCVNGTGYWIVEYSNTRKSLQMFLTHWPVFPSTASLAFKSSKTSLIVTTVVEDHLISLSSHPFSIIIPGISNVLSSIATLKGAYSFQPSSSPMTPQLSYNTYTCIHPTTVDSTLPGSLSTLVTVYTVSTVHCQSSTTVSIQIKLQAIGLSYLIDTLVTEHWPIASDHRDRPWPTATNILPST